MYIPVTEDHFPLLAVFGTREAIPLPWKVVDPALKMNSSSVAAAAPGAGPGGGGAAVQVPVPGCVLGLG